MVCTGHTAQRLEQGGKVREQDNGMPEGTAREECTVGRAMCKRKGKADLSEGHVCEHEVRTAVL